jgi:alpha-glucosidase
MNPAFSRLATSFLALMAVVSCFGAATAAAKAEATRLASPDGRIAVDFHLNADGAPRYAIQLDDHPALQESRLGLVRDDADFSRGLRLVSASRTERVKDKYEILTAKRRVNDYRANRKAGHHLSGFQRRRGVPLFLSRN